MAEDAASRARRSLRGFRQDREPGRPREIRHVVKVHPETERRLVLKATERGITVARLLVESALAGGAEAAKSKAELAGELYRVTRAVGKIGVNVNQIAHATNATLATQPETVEAMRQVQELCDRLQRLLDDVQGPL
ncbi:MobC family plasmid mobilization relaxosome protein [Nocardioides sp. Bht2]|uniref:MobC family plasmid mobilization relaxosome protein n=1 Tax=Nocardioides sp. Bht2 TaxID=3392297 RepID=UPI0039B609B4